MNNILFNLSDVYNSEKTTVPNYVSEEYILGGIISNRIVGISYKNLDLTHFSKEGAKALKYLKEKCELEFESFIDKLRYLSSILNNVDFDYAFLKGAFLNSALYEKGMRTSNDIDVLINAEDITKLQIVLLNNGFVQGSYADGKIVPASRRDIINSRINYGETIPFVRIYNDRVLEVDINFSVDFKASGTGNIVKSFLKERELVKTSCADFYTLCKEDFLIHLCCHLYKEATTYDWVVNRRDLMLYKFSDINVFLHTYNDEIFFHLLRERIKQLNVQKECYYTFKNSMLIYPRLKENSGFLELVNGIKPESIEYMKQIVVPKTKQVLAYDVDFVDWFNAYDRLSLLKEVK